MIVLEDGCYEYHMNHQDVLDAEDTVGKEKLEVQFVIFGYPFS